MTEMPNMTSQGNYRFLILPKKLATLSRLAVILEFQGKPFTHGKKLTIGLSLNEVVMVFNEHAKA